MGRYDLCHPIPFFVVLPIPPHLSAIICANSAIPIGLLFPIMFVIFATKKKEYAKTSP